MKEVWKDIDGWEGQYQISNLGRVKSLPKKLHRGMTKERIMKSTNNGSDYFIVGFRNGNRRKSYLVHRLVAKAFIPNPKNKEEVNHIDGNKQNNIYTNLEWTTKQENINHAWRTGLSSMEKLDVVRIKVDQFTEDGRYITTYNSMSEAEKATRASVGEIGKCCRGLAYHSGGYRWRFSDGTKQNIEPIKYPSNARKGC